MRIPNSCVKQSPLRSVTNHSGRTENFIGKTELSKLVGERTGIDETIIGVIFSALMRAVQAELLRGNRVTFPHLFSIQLSKITERKSNLPGERSLMRRFRRISRTLRMSSSLRSLYLERHSAQEQKP